MAAPSRLIAVNLGMQTVTLAEFRSNPAGGMSLHAFGQEELMVDPGADATRPGQIEAAIASLRKSIGIGGKEPACICLASQSVFSRFVKLPGASPDDVASIIGFEAQQNVPFPIDEVIWDYQIMGDSRDGAWDIVLVAIKADQLDEINSALAAGGVKSTTIDVAPMALFNAFRFNYGDLTGCSLLVDIGARTTNLVFIEGQRIFSRSIPVGGNTISAAVAKEFRQDITLGEKLKLEKGFVSLGGNFAEPADPTDAKISKIVRNTMTRLHSEIARSISFYRQNQAGSAPVRAFLCGGTVSLPYTIEFFNEKLQMPIELFNPLRNVTVSSQATGERAMAKAHMLGEVVGGALRLLGPCPLEINLRPPSVVREQDIAKRKPFLVLAAACLILAPAIFWFYFNRATAATQQMLDRTNGDATQLESVAKRFDEVNANGRSIQEAASPLALAATERAIWGEILDDLAMRLPPRYIWVTDLKPLSEGRTSGGRGGAGGGGGGGGGRQQAGGQQRQGGATRQIDAIQVSGLYLANPPNKQEARIIDEYVNQLQKSEVFRIDEREKARAVIQRTTPDGQSWAYGYTIVLPLRNPITLP